MTSDLELSAPRLRAIGMSILGDREEQQDRLGGRRLDDGAVLLALADGMGGHEGGAQAAQTVVEAALAEVDPAAPAPHARLVSSLERASQDLAMMKTAGGDRLKRCGCTLVLAEVRPGGLHFLSVGDSLLLLRRGGNLMRLNEDHSMASILAEMVRDGELTRDEADRDRRAHMLLSAVTGETPDLVHAPDTPLPLKPGDRIILASDGLLALQPDEIATIAVQEDEAGSCASRLLTETRAARRSGLDNTSVIVCDVPVR